jgi:hypothetical protein
LSNYGDNLNAGTVTSVDTQVLNDDGVVNISVDEASIEEGTTGTSKILTYTVTRTNGLNTSSVEWTLSGVDASDLKAGQATSGTIEFAKDELTKTFTVEVLGDKTIEDLETINVSLSNYGDNLNAGTVTSVDTQVLNDDANISITALQTQVNELNSNNEQTLTFLVTRTNSQSSTTVDWSILDLPAEYLVDGQSQTGTVTFATGVLEQTISIRIVGNDIVNSSQKLTIELSNPTDNSSIATATAKTDILNDDYGFVLESKVDSIIEGTTSDRNTIEFYVIRSDNFIGQAMDIDYILNQ